MGLKEYLRFKSHITRGELIMRVEVAHRPTVSFTLDRDQGGRFWYVGLSRSTARVATRTREEFAPSLARLGLMVVWAHIPSLQEQQLLIEFDEDGDKTELVATGSVTYVTSQWDALKARGGGHQPR